MRCAPISKLNILAVCAFIFNKNIEVSKNLWHYGQYKNHFTSEQGIDAGRLLPYAEAGGLPLYFSTLK